MERERARREADEIRSLHSAFSRCITRIMHTCSNCRWPREPRGKRKERRKGRGERKIAKRGRKREAVSFCFQNVDKCAEGVPTIEAPSFLHLTVSAANRPRGENMSYLYTGRCKKMVPRIGMRVYILKVESVFRVIVESNS